MATTLSRQGWQYSRAATATANIKRGLASDCIEQSTSHGRGRARSGLPCLDQFARDAQQFGEESLAQTQPVSELMDGCGIEMWRIGNLDRSDCQLPGSAAKAVADFGQALDEQIAQCFLRRLS